MQDPTSQVLMPRRAQADDIGTIVAVSAAAHVVLIAGLLLAPWSRPTAASDEPLMTISLGGAPGPRAGGLTSIGGRPVQREEPEPPPKPEPVRPPAPVTPAMTVPVKEPPRPAPKKPPEPVKVAPEEARLRTPPTTGPQVTPGSAVGQTGATGLDLGLSTGGGGAGGEINLADFCCPGYLETMIQLINRQWNPRQGIPGRTTMRFTIDREGAVSDVVLVRSSGYAVLDMAAQRALLTLRLPPLPSAYMNSQLTVHLNFQYQ